MSADGPPGSRSPCSAAGPTAARPRCRLPQRSRRPSRMPPPVLALVSGQALPAFLLCGTLLVIKMYVVAIITGQVRLRKKVCRLGTPIPTPPRIPTSPRALLTALLARCAAGALGRGVSPAGVWGGGPGEGCGGGGSYLGASSSPLGWQVLHHPVVCFKSIYSLSGPPGGFWL